MGDDEPVDEWCEGETGALATPWKCVCCRSLEEWGCKAWPSADLTISVGEGAEDKGDADEAE